ncbi:NUDIX hydrolase [Methanosarcina mazei]|jgi:8-oxo-dGTP diphosphatase|uniref:DNA mismatch repair protein MutT n=7 Tax=Methanosarcina mazei TaxID=2209 RepID=A0A0F8PA46_METMZ|nr:NUDIX domain-containing protein [Methanosarcina mazei]AAM30616.1 MutT related protein [Methanosarcina mazei Go1]AGF96342.1 GDP-mannose mannosyl hydrolase [Methanosarcina mazei Tuc01]AKB39397.1 GDP-mannose mannosyl hydrolase [Methanosarcina mazei WWM610]AKB63581.1 GDP-mannose mannosyl hydrolase [Methanosarcina mazei S-6]AKB66940.1 GDP-mannose mannosyl hydrolase [Methanosarcina mazei LYC]
MNLEKPYIISVYALIRNEKGEFLLLRRSENSRTNAGKWDLPGGKVNPDESLKEGVAREVWEETGITMVPGDIAGQVNFELTEKKVIAIVFDGGYVVADVKLSYEHIEYSWVSLEKILGMETLPAYFRDFFERFDRENKKPSKLFI